MITRKWKIIIFSETWRGSLGYFCYKALVSLGHDVRLYDYRFGPRFIRKRRIQRLISFIVGKNLIDKVNRFAPDMVFILKGESISPKILEKIRRKGIILFNWNPDNPFNMATSTKEYLKSIPIYDCHFTWGRFLIERLLDEGARRVEYLPFAFDPEFHFPDQSPKEAPISSVYDVIFIGTWDREREEVLEKISDYNLAIWGNNWHSVRKNSPLRKCWMGSAKYGPQMAKIVSSAKIVLNLVRKQNRPAHNMRTFEIPACRGFMLATDTPEQKEFLAEGREAVYFTDISDLREKIDYYLRNSEEREKIAKAGYQKVQKETYLKRMEKVIQVLEEIENKKR